MLVFKCALKCTHSGIQTLNFSAMLSSYTACVEGYFKAAVGNEVCEECGPNEVSFVDRTGCMCDQNRGGDGCGNKMSIVMIE